jgi:hypothetical protein
MPCHSLAELSKGSTLVAMYLILLVDLMALDLLGCSTVVQQE